MPRKPGFKIPSGIRGIARVELTGHPWKYPPLSINRLFNKPDLAKDLYFGAEEFFARRAILNYLYYGSNTDTQNGRTKKSER